MKYESKNGVVLAVVAALVPLCLEADAAPVIFEAEPNDSLLTATPVVVVPPGDGGAATLIGDLGVGDVDFYQIDFAVAVEFTASMVGDVGEPEPHHPAILGLLDSQGALVASHQAPLDVLSPFLLPLVIPAGTYYLGISGGNDIGFVGDHEQTFHYNVFIVYLYVPGPASMLPLGVGLIAGRSRRRGS